MTSPKKSQSGSNKLSTVDSAESVIPYEQAVAELEMIVMQMETGNLPLDDAFNAYKRGAELLQICQTSLNHVEQQVQILTDASKLTAFNSDNV
jgi:exodeoxyribonuclease VII small subunit